MTLRKVAHEGIRFTELPPGILRKCGILAQLVMSNRLWAIPFLCVDSNRPDTKVKSVR
jgi:hypothetical protein